MRETVEQKASRLAPLLRPGWVTLKASGRRYRAYIAPASTGSQYLVCPDPVYCACQHYARNEGRSKADCSHIKAARIRRAEETPISYACQQCGRPMKSLDDDGLCFNCWVDRDYGQEEQYAS